MPSYPVTCKYCGVKFDSMSSREDTTLLYYAHIEREHVENLGILTEAFHA